jgi:hypothetical protein
MACRLTTTAIKVVMEQQDNISEDDARQIVRARPIPEICGTTFEKDASNSDARRVMAMHKHILSQKEFSYQGKKSQLLGKTPSQVDALSLQEFHSEIASMATKGLSETAHPSRRDHACITYLDAVVLLAGWMPAQSRS